MSTLLTNEQSRQAEQIVHRWLWASGLSVPADRLVEQNIVGELAVSLLEQLLHDRAHTGQLEPV